MEPQTTPIQRYCGLMAEVKARLAIVQDFTHGARSYGRDDFDAEAICIHLRKSLELIAFGSLVAHRDTYEAAHADIETRWKASQILKRIEQLHPEFYPRPITIGDRDGKGIRQVEFIESGYLGRAEFQTLYDKCSDMMHTWNPFRPGVRLMDFGRSLDEWCRLIMRLLDQHMVRFVGLTDGWIVMMQPKDEPNVRAVCFGPYEPGK